MYERVWSYSILLLFVMLLNWSVPGSPVAQERSEHSGSIVIEGASAWRNWTAPWDLLEINDDQIRPRFIRMHIDAVRDAVRLGASRPQAGSNPQTAVAVWDGDQGTFWEPNLADPLSDWWVQVDLGWSVLATRVVLRFVKEGYGDPFYRFKIFGSAGDYDPRTGSWYWDMLGEMVIPNQEQRVVEYAIAPPVRHEWQGEGRDLVQVHVDTDNSHAPGRAVTRPVYVVY